MAVTATQVKELRDRTGIGMSDCKKALEQNNGDMDAAIKFLREQGAVKQAKRADRVASEGKVAIAFSGDQKRGVISQLNSETDFVSRNPEFIGIADGIAKKGLAAGAKDVQQVQDVKLEDGRTVSQAVDDLRTKIGEKIDVSSYDQLEGDAVAGYVHFSGKSGALLAASAPGLADGKRAELLEGLKNICMHIVATRPQFLDRSMIDEATAAAEREIYMVQARQERRPESILPKIVEGKMNAFYKQSCLVDQPFAMDDKRTVGQVVKDLGEAAGSDVKLVRFVRVEIGKQ